MIDKIRRSCADEIPDWVGGIPASVLCEIDKINTLSLNHSSEGRSFKSLMALNIVLARRNGWFIVQQIKTKYFFDYSIDLKLRRSTVFIENVA